MEPPLLETHAPRWRSPSQGISPIKSAVGLYQFSPQAIARPTTEAEIIQIIQQANQQGLKVRAMGALHSAVPLPATDGVCLTLDRYNQVLRVEGNQVTVQSGIRLWQLNDLLAEQGLALPIMGTIAQQSVAGAISTGTHGGSIHCTSLSGYVQAMRIVQANGNVVEVKRIDPVFNATAIALGTLGIISTVTLQCVPAFSLQTQVVSMPAKALIDAFDEINQQNQFVDIRYSPITDQVHAALINPSPVPLSENQGLASTQQSPWMQPLIENTNKLAQRLFLTHKFNRLQRWGIERYDQHIYNAVSGRSDFVLTHFDVTSTDLLTNEHRNNLDPVADMEIAIAYDQAGVAIAALRDYFQSTQQFPSMHIHLRTQAAEPFWLSPTCGEPICWIEFWEYPRTGKFFQTMLNVLSPFNPRGHWGKQLPKLPAQQYER